jgi:hypothetical protein
MCSIVPVNRAVPNFSGNAVSIAAIASLGVSLPF